MEKYINNSPQYAPALESAANISIAPQYELFIEGKFQPPTVNKYRDSINPADEKILTKIADADGADVDKAVVAGEKAYKKYWQKMPPAERGKYLYRIARMIQEKSRELAIVETLDGGKPIRESRDIDLPLVAQYFFYYAGWTDKLSYAFPNKKIMPYGVVGQIIPWNFPLLMAAWKLAPALATGNTVILKPAENTSLTALFLAEILQEADLPPGVVNIITGGAETGQAMVTHPTLKKIAFTGSTEVGKLLQKMVVGTDKILSLELGGKAPQIVFEDAALDEAVEGIVNGIFFNQGHVCCAGSRLYIQESISAVFIQKLKDRINSLIVGNPLDKNTDIGAINSLEQLKKIQSYLKMGSQEGGTIYQPEILLPQKGYYCAPTLVTDLAQSSRLVQEEIFGPVLTIQTFRTEDEAIEKANNTAYGLSAGIWTDKGSKLFQLAQHLRAGVVWGNTFNKFDPAAPFGGFKESGIGREGGVQGLGLYLQ